MTQAVMRLFSHLRRDMKSLWKNDFVEFARLLSEINALGLRAEQFVQLRGLMDLDFREINSVFERAERAFQKIKQQAFRRKKNHL